MDAPDAEVARLLVHTYRLTIAFLILSWIFISLRVWTRIFLISNFGWDDAAMIMAGVIFTVYCGALFYIATHGAGTVIADFDALKKLMKIATVAESSYVLNMMLIKISLAIFFARIVVKRWHLTLIYVTITCSVISSIAAYLYCFLRCGPDLDQYLIRQLVQACAPLALDIFMAYEQSVVNAITDMVFVIMPVLVLWESRMERRAKFSVGIILVVATLGMTCSFVRFKYIDGVLKTGNYFVHAITICMWSTIESGACIVAGCTATLRPLLKCAVVRIQISTPRFSYGSPGLSSILKNSEQSKRRSFHMKIPDTDLEHGSADRPESTYPLTKRPDYIELVARPDPALVPTNTHTRSNSAAG